MSGFSEIRQYYLDRMVRDSYLAQDFVAGMTFEEYAEDIKTQYATERAVQNVSEAAIKLEKQVREFEDKDFDLSEISTTIEWPKIKAIGSVMRHDYDLIRETTVWEIVTNKLPDLQSQCERALEMQSAFYQAERDHGEQDR